MCNVQDMIDVDAHDTGCSGDSEAMKPDDEPEIIAGNLSFNDECAPESLDEEILRRMDEVAFHSIDTWFTDEVSLDIKRADWLISSGLVNVKGIVIPKASSTRATRSRGPYVKQSLRGRKIYAPTKYVVGYRDPNVKRPRGRPRGRKDPRKKFTRRYLSDDDEDDLDYDDERDEDYQEDEGRNPRKRKYKQKTDGKTDKRFRNDCTERMGHPDTCKMCDKYFENDWDFCAHFHSDHTLPKLGIERPSSDTHWVDDFGTSQPYVMCTSCKRSFKTVQHLNIHKRIEHRSAPNENETENNEANGLPKLNSNLTCGDCGQRLKNPRNFRVHYLRFHPTDEDKIYECDACDLRFTTLEKIVNHRRMAHYDKAIFICHSCGRGYKNGHTFALHMKIHARETEVKKFVCENCGDRFYKEKKLRSHMRKVHESYGDKDSLDVGSRRPRVRVPERQRRGTLEPLNLPELEIYEGKRIFRCKFCEDIFSVEVSFREHVAAKHPNGSADGSQTGAPAVDGRINIKCPVCSKGLNSRVGLKLHIKREHDETKVPMYPCQLCPYQAFTADNVRRHMRRKHLDNIEKAPRKKRIKNMPLEYKELLKDQGMSAEEILQKEKEWRTKTDAERKYIKQELNHYLHPEVFKRTRDRLNISCDCHICDAPHQTAWSLQTHMKTEHPTVEPHLQCPHCNLKHFHPKLTNRHIFRAHNHLYVYIRRSNAMSNRTRKHLGLPLDESLPKPPEAKKKRFRRTKKQIEEDRKRKEEQKEQKLAEKSIDGPKADVNVMFHNQDSYQSCHTNVSENSFAAVEQLQPQNLSHTQVTIDFSSLTPVAEPSPIYHQPQHQQSSRRGNHHQNAIAIHNQSQQHVMYHQQLMQSPFQTHHESMPHVNPFNTHTNSHMFLAPSDLSSTPYGMSDMMQQHLMSTPQHNVQHHRQQQHQTHHNHHTRNRLVTGVCKLCQEASADLKSHYLNVHNVKESSVKDLFSWSGLA